MPKPVAPSGPGSAIIAGSASAVIFLYSSSGMSFACDSRMKIIAYFSSSSFKALSFSSVSSDVLENSVCRPMALKPSTTSFGPMIAIS